MKAVGATIGGLYFAAMFFVLMPGAVLWWSGMSFVPRSDAISAVCLVVIAIGNEVVVSLVRRFVQEGQGTQVPIAPPRFLVQGGIYRHVRNPMYTSYLVIIAAEVLLYRSAALLLYGLACTALAYGYVLHEERLLLVRFGDDYRSYMDSVPRWLPRL